MTTLHHLAMTTSQMDEAARFYDDVLGLLGYERGITSERLCTWHGKAPEILLYTAEGADMSPHTHGRPGWQHAAFQVEDQSVVLSVHDAVKAGNWRVVHEPREYPDYGKGYFAVFVEDPDGIRIEVAYIPG